MEGASWSKKDNSIVDAPPKALTAPLPVMFITGVIKGKSKTDYTTYECPVYFRFDPRKRGMTAAQVRYLTSQRYKYRFINGTCLVYHMSTTTTSHSELANIGTNIAPFMVADLPFLPALQPNFMFAPEIKTNEPPMKWILRGVALLTYPGD